MSTEIGFLVTAGLIVLLFGLKLLFGGATATGMDKQWQTRQENGFSAAARKFTQGLGWEVKPWLVLLPLVTMSLLVLLIFMEIFPGNLTIPALAAGVFALTCLGLMRDIVQWRARRFETLLIDAIDMMIPALRVGKNTMFSLQAAADNLEGMVQREFRQIVQRIELGLDLDSAMQRMNELYDSEGVRMFSLALRSKARMGGDLAMVLTSVNATIRERTKLRMQMAGQLSGIRFAAFILAAAPYLLYGFFLWAQPQWVSAIHQHALGSKLLYGALGIQVAGMVWLFLILNSEH
jgi:tight adherence protein B